MCYVSACSGQLELSARSSVRAGTATCTKSNGEPVPWTFEAPNWGLTRFSDSFRRLDFSHLAA